MARVSLTDAQRQELQQLARRGRDARTVRRAQGLLWLDQGEHPIAIAQRQARLGLVNSRSLAYNKSFEPTDRTLASRRLKREASRPVAQSLRDQPRSGRPRSKRQAMQEMVGQVIDTRPSEYGYQAEGWTADLLRYHLQATRDIEVGENTVCRCLKGMGYRWKRPRYVLARRDPFWCQVKGG